MRINKYKTKLTDDGLAYLVKEKSSNYSAGRFSSPQEIYNFCRCFLDMTNETEEYVNLLCFDSKNKMIGYFEISHGTVNMSVCQPREILIKTLLVNGLGFVIVHNHPSGNPEPSNGDIKVYNRLKEAAKMIGIECLDSIIVSRNGYVSLREIFG